MPSTNTLAYLASLLTTQKLERLFLAFFRGSLICLGALLRLALDLVTDIIKTLKNLPETNTIAYCVLLYINFLIK
jgi:hypothetical protein